MLLFECQEGGLTNIPEIALDGIEPLTLALLRFAAPSPLASWRGRLEVPFFRGYTFARFDAENGVRVEVPVAQLAERFPGPDLGHRRPVGDDPLHHRPPGVLEVHVVDPVTEVPQHRHLRSDGGV